GRRHQSRASAGGEGDLGNVEIAVRIDPQPVRREEAARRTGIVGVPPASEQLAVAIEDTDTAAGSAGLRGPGAGPAASAATQLGDVDPAVPSIDEHLARPGQVGPLVLKLALRGEELQPAVLAIGDEDGAILVDGQAVRNLEMAGFAPRFPPRLPQATIGREAMNAGIAVAVADVQIAGRAERQVRRVVKWRAGTLDRAVVDAGRAGVG